MDDKKTYVSQPLQIMIDIQLGPDGHPWVRMQLATIGMSTSFTFPHESAEDVIANFTTGIRKALKSVHKKEAEIITPDFTGIRANGPN